MSRAATASRLHYPAAATAQARDNLAGFLRASGAAWLMDCIDAPSAEADAKAFRAACLRDITAGKTAEQAATLRKEAGPFFYTIGEAVAAAYHETIELGGTIAQGVQASLQAMDACRRVIASSRKQGGRHD